MSFKNIKVKEAKKLLEKNDVLILDVREKNEFDFGHLPNSLNFPLSQFHASPEEMRFLPKNKPLMVFCRAGGRSLHASKLLASQGFKVLYVEGGLLALNALFSEKKKIQIKEH